MSRLPPAPKLLDLAPELVENIIQQIGDKSDLSNLRLACRALSKPCANALFRTVRLSPSRADIIAWLNVGREDGIREIARRALINTWTGEEDEGEDEDEDDEEDDDDDDGNDDDANREPDPRKVDFEDAISALSRFPNLSSIEIHFAEECVGVRELGWWEGDGAQTPTERESILGTIFAAINTRSLQAPPSSSRTIRSLTLHNLQNSPVPDLTSSSPFTNVMKNIDEFHISMTQEHNEHGPDHDFTFIELQTFPLHLTTSWLLPLTPHLTSLTLYHNTENWGPFPGAFTPDPSTLPFPALTTLALGYYTLAHTTSSIAWILAAKSLRTLILHNCMIASYIRIDPANTLEWAVCTDDWVPLPRDAADPSEWDKWTYGGTWAEVFRRIGDELPQLRDFRFDYAEPGDDADWDRGLGGEEEEEVRRGYCLAARYTCGTRIHPQRYIVFDNGILPTHWPEAGDDGELYCFLDGERFPNLHVEREEEDRKALEGLLGQLRGRS